MDGLTDAERGLYAHLLVWGGRYGRVDKRGTCSVEVPSKELRRWHREYKRHLKGLERKGYLGRGKGYTTHGRAQNYKIPRFPPNALGE